MNRSFFLKLLPGLFAAKEIAQEIKPAPSKGFVFPMPERVECTPRRSDIWAKLDENNNPTHQVYVMEVDPYKKGDPYLCQVHYLDPENNYPVEVMSLKGYHKISVALGEYNPDYNESPTHRI
jgi:hypothetical protein